MRRDGWSSDSAASWGGGSVGAAKPAVSVAYCHKAFLPCHTREVNSYRVIADSRGYWVKETSANGVRMILSNSTAKGPQSDASERFDGERGLLNCETPSHQRSGHRELSAPPATRPAPRPCEGRCCNPREGDTDRSASAIGGTAFPPACGRHSSHSWPPASDLPSLPHLPPPQRHHVPASLLPVQHAPHPLRPCVQGRRQSENQATTQRRGRARWRRWTAEQCPTFPRWPPVSAA